MHILDSPFTESSLNLYHNAFKSLIFRAAEILLALAVYKFFSLIAARADLFTSYLMFAEDYIQRTFFLISRALTRNGLLILCFSVLYAVAQLYGTLLWALDSPGYIFLGKNVTALTLQNSLLSNPAYIVNIITQPSTISGLKEDLPRTIGANLFESGHNFSLTTTVDRGAPKTVVGTREDAFPRIWLDSEGLSVSTDTATMVSYTTAENGTLIPLSTCPVQQLVDNSFAWNCTFNNLFSQQLLTTTAIGVPEVHWDDASDLVFNSRYIAPNRENNIWKQYGEGGGTAVMKQLFQVTKGTRRHTFIETAFRSTMLTSSTAKFEDYEVTDMVKRTWSTNQTEQQAPLINTLATSMLKAQAADRSYMFGITNVSGEKNETTTQVHWQYLTLEVDGSPLYSVIRISSVNITLIRSETIADAPTPFEPCDASTMNVAYGGKVVDTDCQGRRPEKTPRFFGQVDTSAVSILTGLGDGRSNISSKALDENVWQWLATNSAYMDDLLVARGYITSVDPSLVTLTVSVLRPAMSLLQLLLVVIAIGLAFLSYVALRMFAMAHWSNSLLSNLIWTVGMYEDDKSRKPGYIHTTPELRVQDSGSRVSITIAGEMLRLGHHAAPVASRFESGKEMEVGVIPMQDSKESVGGKGLAMSSERDSFLPRYNTLD
jgi:hypothetical protein